MIISPPFTFEKKKFSESSAVCHTDLTDTPLAQLSSPVIRLPANIYRG